MAVAADVPLSPLCPHPATLEGAAVRLAPCVSTLLALARFGPTEWPGSTAFAPPPLSLVPGAMPVPGVSCSPGDLEMSFAAVRRQLGSWEVSAGRRAGGCRGSCEFARVDVVDLDLAAAAAFSASRSRKEGKTLTRGVPSG